MRMNIRSKVLAIVAVTGALMFSAGPALAAPSHSGGYLTCTGGDIASGVYSDITVTGA